MASQLKKSGSFYHYFFTPAKMVCYALFFTGIPFLKAQDQLPQVIEPSPTTVQFQRYGDYPVGHFTGVPEITIPLYTIQEGDISVPISLRYHASGFRRHEQDGHVGMGWTINTGGIISRQVRGLPDETAGMEIPIANPAILNPQGPSANDMYQYLKDAYEYKFFDREFDEYSYNFQGYSGKYLGDATDFTSSDETFVLKADKLLLDGPNGICDENGIVYGFGGGNGQETQWYEQGTMNWITTSTWHLSSIVSSRYPGRGVSYQYQNGKQFSISGTTGANWQSTWDYYYYQPMCDPTSLPYTREDTDHHTNVTSKSYQSKFPEKINFSSGSLTFYLTQQKLLDRIEIKDLKGNLLKTISFQYGTFSIYNGNVDASRAKLQSVIFKDNLGQQIERYGFNYFQENVNVTAKGVDYWGFYNGSSELGIVPLTLDVTGYVIWPGGMIDTYQSPVNVGGMTDHTPYSGAAKLFTLNKVTFPTGGVTEFEYEGNKNFFDQECGGLRVKEIKSYTSAGILSSQKQYTYEYPHQEVTPNNDFYRKENTVQWCQPISRVFLSQESPVNFSPQGSSVVYEKVIETEGEKVTLYHYDVADAYQYERMEYPVRNSDYEPILAHYYRPWRFGNLIWKHSQGPNFYYDEFNYYEEFELDTVADFMVEREGSALCGYIYNNPNQSCITERDWAHNYNVEFFNYANRFHVRGGNRIKEKGVNVNGFGTLTRYEYDSPNHPMIATRIAVSTSKGDSIISNLKYAFDYSTAPYTDMNTGNWLNNVIEEKKYKIPGGTFLGATKTDWKDWGNNVIAPEQVNTKTGSESNAYEPRIRYQAYSANGNVLNVSKVGGPDISYIWGYSGQHPIAEVKNATSNEIYYTGFEEATGFDGYMQRDSVRVRTGDYSGKITNSGSGEVVSHSSSWLTISQTSSRRFKYSGWVYSNGPQAEIFLFMKRSGETGYYSYIDAVQSNKTNQWEYVEKIFEVPADVTALSLRVDNNASGTIWFDDLRLHPAVAQMSTFTYKPLIGLLSATDARNYTQYYEYDKYQRLKLIKDDEGNILKYTEYHFKP